MNLIWIQIFIVRFSAELISVSVDGFLFNSLALYPLPLGRCLLLFVNCSAFCKKWFLSYRLGAIFELPSAFYCADLFFLSSNFLWNKHNGIISICCCYIAICYTTSEAISNILLVKRIADIWARRLFSEKHSR